MADAFDPFADEVDEGPTTSNPWLSTKDWVADFRNSQVNTPFNDVFDFSVTSGEFKDATSILEAFPEDPMSSVGTGLPDAIDTSMSTVHVAMHEQLTSLYDGTSELPTSQVEGYIHVRPSRDDPFCLVLRDPSNQIDSLQVEESVCQDITPSESDAFHTAGDRMFRVALPADMARKRMILSYSCNHRLRPIPLLVKSKVQIAGDRCRVGVKIRSNPQTKKPLTALAVIMAVPPDIQGETVKLSRKGGIWDGMKRVVAWKVDTMEPGALLEIQAQFNCLENGSSPTSPKFPILVRCDSQSDQFSDMELKCNYLDERSSPVRLSVVKTIRILHRKV